MFNPRSIKHCRACGAPAQYAVPADDKQNAHLIIAQAILDALKALRMAYPRSDRARRRELQAIRKQLAK